MSRFWEKGNLVAERIGCRQVLGESTAPSVAMIWLAAETVSGSSLDAASKRLDSSHRPEDHAVF